MQNQALVVVQHGLEYVMACHIPDPRAFKAPIGDVYVYQVGDPLSERQLWRRPEDITVRPSAAVFLGEPPPPLLLRCARCGPVGTWSARRGGVETSAHASRVLLPLAVRGLVKMRRIACAFLALTALEALPRCDPHRHLVFSQPHRRGACRRASRRS